MNLKYIDAHCHVQFEDYAHDQEDVIARMKENGIAGIVVGVDLASSQKAVALAEAHDNLYAAVGLHPNMAAVEAFDAEAFRALAARPKVVAVGECGFDFYRTEKTAEALAAQEAAFRAQSALAAERGLPLIIHARPSKGTMDAYEMLVKTCLEKSENEANRGAGFEMSSSSSVLQKTAIEHPRLRGEARHTGRSVSGDVHFFVGDEAIAAQLFALGFTISFTAVITFARDYDAVIRAAPLERILSETDAPYLSPASRRRERNDPLAVQDVVAQIAEIRGEDKEAVRAALLANARKLFRI